jgi:hypothetical protein
LDGNATIWRLVSTIDIRMPFMLKRTETLVWRYQYLGVVCFVDEPEWSRRLNGDMVCSRLVSVFRATTIADDIRSSG